MAVTISSSMLVESWAEIDGEKIRSKNAREKFSARTHFFNMIRSLAQMFVFDSWDHLMIMIAGPPDRKLYASDVITFNKN